MSSESANKPHKPLVERAGLAVFWNAAFFPLKVLIPFAASIVVVRLLRIEGFATLSIATSFLTTLGLFADLGIERTLPRFYPEIEMRLGRRGIVRLLLAVTVVKGVVLLLLIGALIIAPQFWIDLLKLGPSGGWLLLFVGVLLVLGAASDISLQFLHTHFRQKSTNALDVLAAIVQPTLRALFVLVGWGVVGAMLALVITTIVSVGISSWLALRVLRAIPEEPHPRARQVKRPSTRSLRERLVSLAGLNYLINWTAYLYDLQFIVLVLTFIIVVPEESKMQVAIIALAYQFTKQFLRGLMAPLTGVQTPLFARLYAEGRIEGLRTAYATITKFLLLALLPAAAGLIIICRNLLQIFYGQVGLDAVYTVITADEIIACTVILTVGLFGEAMISVALNVLMVYEEYRAVIIARLVALVSVPLLLLLVPPYGAVGAAIAAAVAGLGSRMVALAFALRRLHLPFPGSFFTRVGIATAHMGVVLLPFLAFLPPDVPSTIAMMAAGVGAFWLAFKLLGGLDQADKERFASIRMPFSRAVLRFL